MQPLNIWDKLVILLSGNDDINTPVKVEQSQNILLKSFKNYQNDNKIDIFLSY